MAKKKALASDLDARRKLVEAGNDTISVARQCELLGISRSGLYYKPVVDESDLLLAQQVDSVYTAHPYYGSRRMAVVVGEQLGRAVNRKCVQRTMREMGIMGIAPGPQTSQPAPGHKVYPYLLRNVRASRPYHVWSTDITYVRLNHGFAYLVAVIDWFSRYVLSWKLSNTMDMTFCIEALEMALNIGTPDIFNTDQGSQFTSVEFTGILHSKGIKISMDGRGRALDNIFVERLWRTVKYEDIYIQGYEGMEDAQSGLDRYFTFYNDVRPHSAIGYMRPREAHFRQYDDVEGFT